MFLNPLNLVDSKTLKLSLCYTIEMTGAVWYAILVYIFGMAVVVYYRPAIMFKPSGTWKEFGLTEGYTIFPFWMFVLVWSILSYALVTMGSVFI